MLEDEKNIEKLGDSTDLGGIQLLTQKNLQVVLFYFAERPLETYVPYGQRILQKGVNKIGIPVLTVPIYAQGLLNNTKYRDLLVKLFSEDPDFQINGISVDYEKIPVAEKLINIINDAKREKNFIVVGGQGTADEGTRKHLFNAGADSANIGDAQPFFDFLKKVKQTDIISRENMFQSAKGLLATIDEPTVEDGVFPYIYPFPLLYKEENIEENRFGLSIPHFRNCPNNCDYCACKKIKGCDKVLDIIIRTLKDKRFSEKIIDYVKFQGPTFEGPIVKDSMKILETIKERQGFMPTSHVVMDSKQFQERKYKHTVTLLDKANADDVHIGINSLDGQTASEVGRRNNGVIRTEKELQEEIAGVLKFIRDGKVNQFKVDILLSPFDTVATTEKIIDVATELFHIERKSHKTIDLFLSPLVAYPGTPLFERHKDKINFTDYRQLSSSSSYDPTLWKEDEKLYGTKFLRRLSAPYLTSTSELLTQDRHIRKEYLQLLALSMTHQYLQGKTTIDEMDLIFPEGKDDMGANAIFNAIKTQSLDLMTGKSWKEFFEKNQLKSSQENNEKSAKAE